MTADNINNYNNGTTKYSNICSPGNIKARS